MDLPCQLDPVGLGFFCKFPATCQMMNFTGYLLATFGRGTKQKNNESQEDDAAGLLGVELYRCAVCSLLETLSARAGGWFLFFFVPQNSLF